jgi:hypothetical protein
MSVKFPFEPNSPIYGALMQQVDWARGIEQSLAPMTELQRAVERLSETSKLRNLELGISPFLGSYKFELHEVTALQAAIDGLIPNRLPDFKLLANPASIAAIRRVTQDLESGPFALIAAQNAAIAALAPNWQIFADRIEAQSAALQSVMAATKITEPFARFSEQFAPLIDEIRIAAELSRYVDGLWNDDREQTNNTSGAEEFILDACQIVDDMRKTSDPELQVGLITKLARIIALSFKQFKQNTAKEFRAIGAIKLFELTMILVAFAISVSPTVPEPEEAAALSEIQSTLNEIGPQILALVEADQNIEQAYLAELARGELIKSTPIRLEPDLGSTVLLNGEAGDALAIKGEKGTWLLVVFRDPLTQELSEGCVHKKTVRPLGGPER